MTKRWIDEFRRLQRSGATVTILCVLGKEITGRVTEVGADWLRIELSGPAPTRLMSESEPVTLSADKMVAFQER